MSIADMDPFEMYFQMNKGKGKDKDDKGVKCVEINNIRFVFKPLSYHEYKQLLEAKQESECSEFEFYVKICETCLILPQGDIRDMDDVMNIQEYLIIIPTLADAIIQESDVMPGKRAMFN